MTTFYDYDVAYFLSLGTRRVHSGAWNLHDEDL